MTQSTTDSSPDTGRRFGNLGELGKALDPELTRLQEKYLAKCATERAHLARLRRGLGKKAGSVPDIWELTVGKVPARMVPADDEPGPAEQAAHAAMTLYALHQQSLTVPMHKPGERFGAAVRRLKADKQREEAVTRRFMAVATAQSIDEVLFHVRGLITQLRRDKHGLDYAMFADDILKLLTPGREIEVRLAWGRDFYRVAFDDEASEPTSPQDTSTPDNN